MRKTSYRRYNKRQQRILQGIFTKNAEIFRMMLCSLLPYMQNALPPPKKGSERALTVLTARSARNPALRFKYGLMLSDTEHDRHRKGAILFIV